MLWRKGRDAVTEGNAVGGYTELEGSTSNEGSGGQCIDGGSGPAAVVPTNNEGGNSYDKAKVHTEGTVRCNGRLVAVRG